MRSVSNLNKGLLWFALLGVAALAGFFFFGTEPEETAKVAVKIPALSGPAEQGQAVFEANCARCHGVNAAGSDQGPPLIHRIYEPNHHADLAFVLAARRGVRAHHWRFGDMPPVPEVNERDVTLIVAYIRELQKANGIF